MSSLKKQNVKRIQVDDKLQDFETIFQKYYTYLCFIAEQIVKSPIDAEEVVSEVMLKLWSNLENTEIVSSVKTYLVRAVHNTALNYLQKHKPTNFSDLPDDFFELRVWDDDYPLGQFYENEVIDLLREGIRKLPSNCRKVFLLSRDKGLTYEEIADKLHISVNTVKTQIKIALLRLREVLKDYLSMIFV